MVARTFVLVLFMCSFIFGCGTVPSVRPIGKGERAVTLSSGGPITKISGITMPIPYAVARYRQGVSEKMDVHVALHPTMLLLANLGIDIGVTRRLVQPSGWRPSVSLEGSIYGFYHHPELSSIRAYPELTVLSSYETGWRRQLLYFGVQNMFQASRPYIVSVPLVGFETPFFGRIVLNAEGKWYAPMEGSDDRAVDYTVRPLDHGALGMALGATYRF